MAVHAVWSAARTELGCPEDITSVAEPFERVSYGDVYENGDVAASPAIYGHASPKNGKTQERKPLTSSHNDTASTTT